MATIIEHRPTGRRYILLGAGYGVWASSRPNRVLGDLFAHDRSGENHMLYVCDADGDVFWLHPNEARVVEVDGRAPGGVLG
ncbi:MAG: hypothetical protein RBS39_10155 [Phycisphaerales bacterium]|jgi:hypothetical protein|nr:hypothetical protein [Phycisphaerales bacterium]